MSASGAPLNPGESRLHDRKLDSWKEIADYLDREVRTVQRWEKTENLPVHRHEHQKKSTVYAYTGELDEWRKKRQPKDDPEADDAFVPEPDVDDIAPECGNGNANVDSAAQPSPAAPVDSPESPAPRAAIAMTAAVLVLIAGFLVYRWIKPGIIRPTKVRMVVIPFSNLSGDAKQDYFSAGLTDEMITRLGSLDPAHLGVIAAASSNALAGKPITEIGRALDVQYALEGSVRREGNRVRIDAQLIQVSDQTNLWADKYDRDLNDILGVQEEVAAAVATQIRVALNPPNEKTAASSSQSKGPPAPGIDNRPINGRNYTNFALHPFSPDAYDAYLRGRFYWTNRGDLHKSIEAYRQAIQKDPKYALAYAGLASSYALLGQVPYDDLAPSDAKPKARDAAKRALELDPSLAEAHAVLGNVAFSYDWNFETAEQEFQRAIALGPNNPVSHHWFGHYCIVRNRLPQALEENSHTLELDPVSPLFNTTRAEIKYHMRDYDAAIEQGRRTIEQYPAYPLAYIWLGSAYREKKMYREALDSFSQGRRLSGDHPAMIALYGHALAISGDAAGARKALADLQHLAQSRYVSSLYFAMVYLGLGENTAALDYLDRAYDERTDRLVYLGAEPMADPLRSDPRFTQLLHKIGIQ
ncbi:MAG TPA: tetratricopeptide repeat protein [Candidatus Acidoferrum sp.]|nr:tetratricopeptide repeat protein [Candidatus Acidoferrum sp.]